MAWTSPQTWATGDIILRTEFDTYLRDQQRQMAPAKVTTKGDAIIADGANSISRFGIGTDRQLLRYDSGEPLGLRWAWDAIPSGLILPFTTACPSGWTEYTTSQGRFIVGTPSGGTDEGTVGSAMGDLADGTHTHTGPSHNHTIASAQFEHNAGSGFYYLDGPFTAFGGTAATGTAAISGTLPYIQLRMCEKD